MIEPTIIRTLLDDLGLSQREAARQLEIGQRTMRRYCAAGAPTVVWLALSHLKLNADQKHQGEDES